MDWSSLACFLSQAKPPIALGRAGTSTVVATPERRALDAYTGLQLWRFETGGLVISSPAVVGGVVYVGSDDGYVYAIGGGG